MFLLVQPCDTSLSAMILWSVLLQKWRRALTKVCLHWCVYSSSQRATKWLQVENVDFAVQTGESSVSVTGASTKANTSIVLPLHAVPRQTVSKPGIFSRSTPWTHMQLLLLLSPGDDKTVDGQWKRVLKSGSCGTLLPAWAQVAGFHTLNYWLFLERGLENQTAHASGSHYVKWYFPIFFSFRLFHGTNFVTSIFLPQSI